MHRAHKPKIAAGCADAELIPALFHDPAVLRAAPNGKAPFAKRDKYRLFLAGQQLHARKARERKRRAQHAAGFRADIELRDLRPGAAAGVFHREAHAAGRKFAGRVGKLRIAQSVAERIFDALVRAFIIPVADEQPLAVFARRLTARVPWRAGRVLEPDGHRLGELAAGVRLAREERGARRADGLPAETEMQHRAGKHIPRHFHRAAALQHDADVRVDLRDLAQKVELVFSQTHVPAVIPLRFASLVQAEEEQYLFASRGKFLCPAQQPRRGGSAAKEAFFISDDVHAGVAQRVERRIQPRGVDMRAARALIARHGGKIADDGNALKAPQREKFLLVFQQHRRLRRGFRGKRMVRRAVENAAVRERFLRAEHKVQHMIDLLVEKGLVERPAAHGLHDVPVGLAV